MARAIVPKDGRPTVPGPMADPPPVTVRAMADQADRSGRGTGADGERDAALAALRDDPRPAVSRAALAARYPAWGLVTLSLLAVGLIVGFASFGPLGRAIEACRTDPTLLVCRPRMHAVVVALPVAALLIGLTVSLVGGRLVAQRGRSPLPLATLGWLVFLLGTPAAYLLAGLL